MIIECKGTEKFADMQMVLGYTYKFIDWRLCEVPLYNIVVLNTQRFVVFAPKIGEVGGWNGIYNTREAQCLLDFPREWFFLKKIVRAEYCAEKMQYFTHCYILFMCRKFDIFA